MLMFLINSLRYIASLKSVGGLDPPSIKTILLVELTRLGDVVVMLTCIDALREQFADAEITVLVDQQYTSLLESFETKSTTVGVHKPSSPFGLLQAVRTARKERFDLAVSMSPPRRNALTTLASNSRFKLGYLSSVDSLTPFLESVPVESFGFSLAAEARYERENIYDRPAKILATLGIRSAGRPKVMKFKPQVYEMVKARLAGPGLIPKRRYIVLCPFSGWEYRRWGVDHFISLARRIVQEFEYEAVFSGDEEQLGSLRSKIPLAQSENMKFVSGLQEAAVLMNDASLVVGNDSGPLHLAAALNVPTIGLFGPAPPWLTAPRTDNGTFFYKQVECSPCNQRACVRPEHSCMKLHTVDEIFRAVANVIRAPVIQQSPSTNVED